MIGFRRPWTTDHRLREQEYQSWFEYQGVRLESLD